MDGVEISYTTIALPNYSLEDHWNAPLARKEIASGKYDFVVAQQGPSAALESRELLKRDARRFAKACTKAGSAWGLYMVWPSSQRSFDLDGVITSYSEAATLTSGLLCPAGLAWKLAWREQPDLPLYGPDGFHPSLMGSILAAMTIYAAVQKKENLDFIAPDRGSWGNVIGRSELELLKRSALMAVKR
jgi:hypothetical protein